MVAILASLGMCAVGTAFFLLVLRMVLRPASTPPPPVAGRTVLWVAAAVHGCALLVPLVARSIDDGTAWIDLASVILQDGAGLALSLLAVRLTESSGWLRQVSRCQLAGKLRMPVAVVVMYLPLRLAVDALYDASVRVSVALGYTGPTTQPLLEAIPQMSLVAQLVIIVWVALLTPVYEEVVFRGVVYGWLSSRFPEPWAALASGLIFGLYHDPPVLQPCIALLGTGLALAYRRSGSLVVPVLLHAMFNAHTTLAVLLGF